MVVLPASWQEVPTHLRLPLLKLLLTYKQETAIVKALELLCGLPKHIFLALSNNQIIDLAAVITNWYFIEISEVPLITHFTHNNITYYLPSEGLENCTAIEYPLADEYYETFITEQSDEALLCFIATLCREANPNQDETLINADPRKPILSRHEAESRAKALVGLPVEIATAVMNLFIGSKKMIHDTYGSWLFKQSEEEDDVQQEDDSDEAFLGWWGLYMDIAEAGIFGNLKEVHQTNFHTICLHLVKKKKEAIAQEKRLKNLKKNEL